MSWDIFVQDIPVGITTVAEIQDDFVPKPIGSRKNIVAGIVRAAPETNFSDPYWGTIDGPDFSIEVNISDEDPVTSFAFHVRGGEAAVYVIQAILNELRLRAFDTGSETGLFDGSSGSIDAFRRWSEYRDQISQGTTAKVPS